MNAAVAAAIATVIGAFAGERLGPGDGYPLLAVAALGVAGAAGLPRSVARAAVVAVVCALLAGAGMQRALDGLVRHPLPLGVAASFEGALVGDPKPARFWAEARLRVDHVDGRPVDDRVVVVRATGEAATAVGTLASGDRVVLRGRLTPLSGYETRFRWQHAVATLRTTHLVDFAAPTDPIARTANAARDVVFAGMAGLGAEERALLAGFLLGDTGRSPTRSPATSAPRG